MFDDFTDELYKLCDKHNVGLGHSKIGVLVKDAETGISHGEFLYIGAGRFGYSFLSKGKKTSDL